MDRTLYYATDAGHNVTAVVTEAGQLVERQVYDPYGRAVVLNGTVDPDGDEYTPDPDNASDVGNPLSFAGHRRDAETGLVIMRHRYHHPTLGRFVTRDPAGYADGLSLYQYALSSPANGTDPMGLRFGEWNYSTFKLRRWRYVYDKDGSRKYKEKEKYILFGGYAFEGKEVIKHDQSSACAVGREVDEYIDTRQTNLSQDADDLAFACEVYIRLNPISDWYEFGTGKDCIRGEELTALQRALAGCGLVVEGGGWAWDLAKLGKCISKLDDARKVRKLRKLVTKAKKLAEDGGDIEEAARIIAKVSDKAGDADTAKEAAEFLKVLESVKAAGKKESKATAAVERAKDIKKSIAKRRFAPNSALTPKIGHTTPWSQMTAGQRKAFQHSYSRHAKELGLPNWSQKNAGALQKQFNDVVGYIRQHGTKLPGPINKPWNGKSVEVNLFEAEFYGTKYYYYEDAATGTFISAGRSR